MNEEIKFGLEYLKNITNGDVLAPRHIQNIEEYIEGLIYCINNNNLQSKIDKVIECLVNNIDLENDDFTKIDLGCDVLKILDLDKYNEFLKENK